MGSISVTTTRAPWPRSAPGPDGPLAFLYEGLLRSYDAETLPNGAILMRLKER